MTLETPESWENFGQIVITLVWIIIALGIILFIKGSMNRKPSSAKQELERRRQEEENRNSGN